MTTPRRPEPPTTDVLADRPGATPGDQTLEVANEAEERIGVRGPTSWWRLGVLALAVLAAILLALQYVGGNKGTAVVPGTPVAAPQSETGQ